MSIYQLDTFIVKMQLINFQVHHPCSLYECTEMTLEFSSLQPFLEKTLKIQDTCGVHNLHAMPGVLGGVVGAITAAAATEEVYGHEGYVSKT